MIFVAVDCDDDVVDDDDEDDDDDDVGLLSLSVSSG